MIKLFWCPQTRASRILWMLEEMDEPFEIEVVDLRKPETKSADFLAASPMGKVPALSDGPVKIAASSAIALRRSSSGKPRMRAHCCLRSSVMPGAA